MTKLLSNIIKWNYINFDENGKHVIDSDHRNKLFSTLADEAEQKLIAGIHIASPQEIADNFLKREEVPDKDAEFISGMNVINYDKIMEEERERIAEKADSLISNAEEKVKMLIDEANSQVDSIKARAFEEGKAEGFEAGFLEGQESLLQKEAEIGIKEKDLIARQNELEIGYQNKVLELEPFFTELTMSLIEKITGIVVENKKDVILYLIKNGMEDAGQNQHFFIHVSSEDLPVVKQAKESIEEELLDGAVIDIVEDVALTANQCIIETNTKMIDSSLDIVLRNLIEDLRILSITK